MSEYRKRIYHLKGTPFAIGAAMGQALGSRLEANIERYVRERVPHDAQLDVDRWRSGALPVALVLPGPMTSSPHAGGAHGQAWPAFLLARRVGAPPTVPPGFR
jgi:hypothetical protein